MGATSRRCGRRTARVVFASDRGGGPFTLYSVNVQTGTVSRIDAAGPGAQSPVSLPRWQGAGLRGLFGGRLRSLFAAGSILWQRSTSNLQLPTSNPPSATPTAQPPTFNDQRPTAAANVANYTAVAHARAAVLGAFLRSRWRRPVVRRRDRRLRCARASHATACRRAGRCRATGSTPRSTTPTRGGGRHLCGRVRRYGRWRDGTVRSRELTAGVLLPWRKVRWSSSLLAAASASSDDFDCAECDEPVAVTRGAPGRSPGSELLDGEGIRLFDQRRGRRRHQRDFRVRARRRSGTATSMAGELRGYVRAFPRHAVLAARVAGASSHGDDRVRRDFSASGSGPQFGGFDVGLDAIGLLRGFDSDDLIDRHAAVVNLDYRVPDRSAAARCRDLAILSAHRPWRCVHGCGPCLGQ